MGIPGLTGYINNHSDHYLRYYELHNTYLVIDGNNVGCQIYHSQKAYRNCAFGGNYDGYARDVSIFFDDLLKCGIKPLVLIDGGTEDKKLKTVIKRTNQKIQKASTYSPCQNKETFLPVLQGEVFRDVMREKNIRQESMLPLAAILFGNDYVKRGTFKNFFRHLKLKTASTAWCERERCIEAIFSWLSKFTLDEAVANILTRIPKPSRRSVLNLIEENISYTNSLAEILVPLGFPGDYLARRDTSRLNRSFKFNGDIDTLTYMGEVCEGEEEVSEKDDDDEIELISTITETESLSRNEAISKLPEWFVNEYLLAKYPPYFMNMIVRRLYSCPIQIENINYSSSNVITLKIISVIFGLLKSAINDKVRYMRCIIRDQSRIVLRELEGTETLDCCKLPSLSKLREIPSDSRKEILNKTLGISDTDGINELPPNWILYFGCIKYWIREQEPTVFHKSNVYAILIGTIFHIIDSKIGAYRSARNFEERKSRVIENIKRKRRANNYKPNYKTNGTVIEAYNEICYDDCLLAASFFISHFQLDRKLRSNPKLFNRSIVHAFAEFQICLRQVMSLNALLGCPYPQTTVATFYNGTLLYNLSTDFKTHQDIEKYINAVLEMSPSLLRLFHILLSKVVWPPPRA
ncbi:protein asteroid-like [Ceratina calcarata]|uniref:Protein asteroid-like n=1 Tax=Ceratina calcarata TaxID=156304 RepID=A0AAJ7S2F5_9HYME|nr:protein asteroid-like [Ceratina calcarata]